MILDVNYSTDSQRKKIERLAFIKERYKKLVLDPRREIEFEIERALDDEDGDIDAM
ncbi:MAG: hypothetical protein QY310_12435 [Candidatus Jettenia sp. CY-1]|nr:hypothetical protein [Candidatus Jettenia sp.]UJS17531.1 MAG: hypothetical protein L3J17_00325 [Candidatus Jettenia sp.]WKZ18228.1 MAG: hypothetical protein QY310_12435 [Candidatus Jettenia sp. CY-1]